MLIVTYISLPSFPAVPQDDCTQNRKCPLTNSTISLFSKLVLKNQIIINIRLLCNGYGNQFVSHILVITTCHSACFVMYSSSAQFKEHSFNNSRDICDWQLYCFSETTYDIITFLICIIQIHKNNSKNGKKNSKKENVILLYFQRAFQVSSNLFFHLIGTLIITTCKFMIALKILHVKSEFVTSTAATASHYRHTQVQVDCLLPPL